MAKVIDEKLVKGVDWEGYSGKRVQEFIKEELNTLETGLNNKVGYIVENEAEGKVYFASNKENYDLGITMGVVNSTPRYAMDLKFDVNNKSMFLSNDNNKTFSWYFKTKDLATGGSYPENVSVEYTILNETEGKQTTHSTIIESNADIQNDNYTKVTMDLNEYVTNGTSLITIVVRGLRTKQELMLQTRVSIITLEMTDNTDFSKSFKDNFIVNMEVKCTKHQRYFIEYRFNPSNYSDMSDFTTYANETIGSGKKETLNINLPFPQSGLIDGKHVFEYRLCVKIDNDTEPYYTRIQRIEFIKGENPQFNEPQILIFSNYAIDETPLDASGNLIINGVSQYVPFSVKYAVYNSIAGSTNVEFYEVKDEIVTLSTSNTVFNGNFANYEVQAMQPGVKTINIITKDAEGNILNNKGRYVFINVSESILNISVYNKNLRIDFSSVGKSNESVDKTTWISNVGGIFTNNATFNDAFDWSQGWTENGLVVSEGCEVSFDYAPFPKSVNDPNIYNVGGLNAYTFEIEFMTQNVTDENAVVCDMTDERGDKKTGLQITGSEIKFTTPNGESVSTRFKSGEMNRATIVIYPSKDNEGKFSKGLVQLYINGILSNITKYTEGEVFEILKQDENNKTVSKNLTFKGVKGADIVVKYIRAYEGALEGDDIVDNYIIYRTNAQEMLTLYNKNNVINEQGVITPQSMIKIGNIPVLIFIGRTKADELASGDGNTGDGKGNCNEEYKPGAVNANEENWYKTLEDTTNKKKNVDMDVIYYDPIDKSKNFKFVKAYITPQGTSSMYYPKKNYRIYTQKNKDTRCFFSDMTEGGAGALEFEDMIRWNFGETEIDRKWEKWRGTKNYKKRKYSFKNNAQAVKCWCLKADFAETSSSHNTGVARLWGDTLKNSTVQIGNASYPVFKTNAQATIENNYNDKRDKMPDIRTTIDGFPIVVFGAKSYSDEIVFLGQYNFNNDKSTESVFGFCDIDDENILTDNGKDNYTPHNTQEAIKVEHTLDEMLDKYMCCVETLDNGNALANFSTMEDFDGSWDDAFEFRYMEIPEEPEQKDYKDENGNWTETGEKDYYEDLAAYNKDITKWNNTRLKPFKHFAQWLYDTRWCDVYGNILPGLTTEEAEARKNKFATEKWDHLDVWKMAAYYIYAMRFGAVDQIVKNSMLTSEGPFAMNKNGNKMGYWDTTDESAPEYGQFYKWYYINYDNDTVLGVKNDGSLAYGPEITRTMKEGSGSTASYIYAGSNSTLWNNLDADEEFKQIVRIADQGISKTMTYAEAIKMFDEEQVGKWCERIYNKDAEYKYISPYLGDWSYTGEDENVENFVDKLFMLQGSRTAHRRWWMSKRFSLFDGKWNSGDFPEKFIEVKCDYGSIGDTFSAIAGANAYFGYTINNKTFPVNEGENPWMGGETFEFKQGDIIDWKLYKNIQIGDPIGIFGSTDMVELNLMGLAKNLSSVSFRFGNNADISNKLERLYLSIPEELLFANATYKVYSHDEEGTVNRKTAFEKLKMDYDDINESDFIEGAKYPTSEEEFDATDLNSPDFYRSPVKVEDEEGNESIIFVYFAKVSENIRNHSCKELSFDNLDKLQDLKVVGYMGLKSLNLTNNKFINSIDARYSNIGNITFAEGARIKDIKVSDKLTDLVLTRCNNVKLENIMVNSMPLKNNSGITISKISIDNSDGLNHDDNFKDFILKWMKGGPDSKPTYSKSLLLKGIIWEDIKIEDIETIINFAKAADSCEISGVISMGANNLSKADFELIETVFKKIPGIDVVVKIPYPNILIEVQPSMVAGQEISLSSILYSDLDYSSENYTLEYTFIEETEDEEAENSFFDGKTGKRYVKISDDKIRNGNVEIVNPIATATTIKSKEIVLNEDTQTLLAVIFNYEGTTKFDIASLEIKDPTYVTAATINGETMINEVGKTFVYDLELVSNKNAEPIGTFDVTWSVSGSGVKHIEIIPSDDEKTLSFKTNSVPDDNELLTELNINAIITNFSGSNYDNVVVNLGVYILNENIILTDKTNPTVMAICYENNWASDSQYLTKEEAANITDIGTAFSNVKGVSADIWSFEEFKYFTGVTTIPDVAFSGSNLTTINIPDNVTELGVGVFENCKKLETVKMSENVSIISEKTFLNCSKLENFILPVAVKQIDKNAFGSVGFEKIMKYNGKFNGVNTLFIHENSSLTTIKNDAFEVSKWNNGSTTNNLTEVYLPKNLVISDQQYNFLLSSGLTKINLVDIQDTNLRFDDNILYADKARTKVVRALPISETNIDVLDLNIVDEVYPYAFFNCNSIKKVIFNEPLFGSYLRDGAFINSNIEEIDLSKCNKLERIWNYTFYNMENLKSVLFPENGMLKEMGIQVFYNSPKLEELVLPDTVEKLGTNTSSTYFINNCGIKSFKLPQSLTSCGRNIIVNCANLEEFVFSDKFNLSSTVAQMVDSCSNLKIVKLPIFSRILENGEYEIVNNTFFNKGDKETFINCNNIEKFVLHEDDNRLIMNTMDEGKSIIRIGNSNVTDNTINPCEPKLVKVVYSATDYTLPDNIEEIETGAFAGCNNLSSVKLNNVLETISSYAFAGCNNLSSVKLNNVLETIGSYAFASCGKLESINLPNTLTSIGESAFRGCGLKEIIVPENITSINRYTFYECDKLEKVELKSENLQIINDMAFVYCSNLKEILILSSNAPELKTGSEYYRDYAAFENVNIYQYHPFGYNEFTIVGSNINEDKKLFLPNNNYGYDTEKWIYPLSAVCNFEFIPIIIENDIAIVDESLNNMDMVYIKREANDNIEPLAVLSPYNEGDSKRIVMFNSEKIYHGETIVVYSDEECNNEIGKFEAKYGKDVYNLTKEIVMGSTYSKSLFNTNIFEDEKVVENNDMTEMANITKHEYNLLLAKVNQLMKLLNKKK